VSTTPHANRLSAILRRAVAASVAAVTLLSCSGGGGGGGGGGGSTFTANSITAGAQTISVAGETVLTTNNLTGAQVEQVIRQAAAEARARVSAGRITGAVIAVVDRVGNTLALYQVGTPPGFTITSGYNAGTGLEDAQVPVALAAFFSDVALASATASVAKAVTGAYLSSGGNGFTTRTASQIVQENFNPGQNNQAGGPLFGVQFSQLPCSDLARVGNAAVSPDTLGPKRSPLGLSADAGGLPLYLNGVMVGGIGVLSDGVYGLDRTILDIDTSDDELIAVAGMAGFAPPEDLRANRITVDGISLRFADRGEEALLTRPSTVTAALATTINPALGAEGFITLPSYYEAATVPVQVVPNPAGGVYALPIRVATAFGTTDSGIGRPTAAGPTPQGILDLVFDNPRAFTLLNADGTPRFAILGGTDAADVGAGNVLTQTEVATILGSAIDLVVTMRAQIRRPLGSAAQVTISIVDTNGQILGLVRAPDAPIFGTDVSLQKARTATFFSGLDQARLAAEVTGAGANVLGDRVDSYVLAAQTFTGANFSASIAFSDRSGGLLSRPFFPDGVNGSPSGPFSRPFGTWSPFSTGLQLDSVLDDIAGHLTFLTTANAADDARQQSPNAGCTNIRFNGGTQTRVGNGFQIFPGSVPIYRGNVLIGGIGVSGDGIDQDDMISFYGLDLGRQALVAGGAGSPPANAPAGIRADTLQPQGVRLRYVSCPGAPFLNGGPNEPCQGI
jgi:uncharacterized protein GlcG (DUF336 family)